MKLTIYFNGQFYVGLVETISKNTLKAYLHVFGKEPNDQEVLKFIHADLLSLLANHQSDGVPINKSPIKKLNPKRLQRQISKELAQTSISTKAQEAFKKEFEHQKKLKKAKNKEMKEIHKQFKRDLKIEKAKKKHKGK